MNSTALEAPVRSPSILEPSHAEPGVPAQPLTAARTEWLLHQRFNQESLRHAQEEIKELRARLEAGNAYVREAIEHVTESDDLVGNSPALLKVLRQVSAVAGTSASVLITGETGTGKELVARAVHKRSRRRDKPFVTVNCGALAPTLAESELFGHERGAFTGAMSRRIGRFELAHQGTILLDEIGELPLDLQPKLLRMLQSGEFERVGSSDTRRVDVRVLASTNRNLEQAVEHGAFRRDLYHRLRVFPIPVPPLRERREDIPLLVPYLVEKKAVTMGKRVERIPRQTMETLVAYDWPGNVRELENVIERGLILSQGAAFAIGDALGLPAGERAKPPATARAEGPTDGTVSQTLAQAERTHILRVCEACDWRIKGPGAAAKRLGLNPSTLYFRMKKLGIRRPQPA